MIFFKSYLYDLFWLIMNFIMKKDRMQCAPLYYIINQRALNGRVITANEELFNYGDDLIKGS